MAPKFNGFWSATLWVSLAGALAAQAPHTARCARTGVADFPRPDRRRDDGRHRQGSPGPFHCGFEEGRVRGLRGRRQAGHRVDDHEPRRAGHERAGGAAATRARRRHPSARAPRQRHIRPHLPFLRRRSAPAVPVVGPRAGAVQEDLQAARSRRRHVRHRLERALVDRHRHDVRPQAPRRCDQQDCG